MKSKVVAAILSFFGLGYFYIGNWVLGIVNFLLMGVGIGGIWSIVNMIFVLTGKPMLFDKTNTTFE